MLQRAMIEYVSTKKPSDMEGLSSIMKQKISN